MERFIRKSLHKVFVGNVLRVHASGLEAARNSLKAKLGSDPGLFTALAYYITHETKIVDDPVIIARKDLKYLQDNALCDDLTRLGNKRLFNIALSKEFERSKRARDKFSLIMLDVDYFKQYNDTFGHVAGDKALTGIGDILRLNSRKSDYALRYGGEEFALLLPGTCQDNALLLAERLRKSVERHRFEYGTLTISLGLSEYQNGDRQCFEIVERADKALYRSKELCRNTICVSGQDNRRHPRFPLRIPVQFGLSADGRPGGMGESVNISRGGMLLHSMHPLREETTLCTRLFSPRGRSRIELCGRVINNYWDSGRQSNRVALQFLKNETPAVFEEFFSALIFNESANGVKLPLEQDSLARADH